MSENLTHTIDRFGNEWYFNEDNKLHREDGPAIIYIGGVEEWYRNGKLHREDGPALIANNGKTQEWYRNGMLHREDGPALIWEDENREEYYLHGEKVEPF